MGYASLYSRAGSKRKIKNNTQMRYWRVQFTTSIVKTDEQQYVKLVEIRSDGLKWLFFPPR